MLNEKTWKAMAHQGHKEVTEKRDERSSIADTIFGSKVFTALLY